MKKPILILLTFILMLASTFCKNKATDINNGAAEKVAKKAPGVSQPLKTILFFGNSLTAGYGLEDAAESFPSRIQARIDSLHLPYKTINAGVSGETSAGGNGRIDWVLKQPVDIFVLELGANDGLRGIPVAETKKNLRAIISKVKSKYPQSKLVLAGMQIPPNMGADYATDFRNIFPDLAAKNKMALIPFLLQGVGGVRELNQADGIHPTAAGAKIVTENVWKILKGIL